MQGRDFVIGFAAGALAAIGVVALSSTASGDAPPAAVPTGGDAEPDVGSVAEVARLRAEVERLSSRPSRREVEPAEAAPDSASDLLPDVAVDFDPTLPPADLAALLAELELQFRCGALADRYANDPEQLRLILVDNWINAGEPAQALALLRGVEPPSPAVHYAALIGDQLRERGDNALAEQAYLLNLQNNPGDWEAVRRLMETAPAAALAQLNATPPPGQETPETAAQRALLKLAAGDREAGLAELDRLIEAGSIDARALHFLVERDPSAAEERLRAAIDGSADEDTMNESLLADALMAQGKRDEAIALVESLLERTEHDTGFLRKLAELDRSRAMRLIEERLSTSGDAELFSVYAEQLIESGRQDEGIAAYWRAYELEPGWASTLLHYAPEAAAQRLALDAAVRGDDELFGDIADALWQVGRHDEARRQWERAHEIDRTDSEWTGKLAKVARGLDPLR